MPCLCGSLAHTVYSWLAQAFFNVMLRRFGVQGVKVQEVVSLDDELLVFLP